MSLAYDIPDWKSYNNDEYYMCDVPAAFWGEFSGISLRAATNDRQLKSIIFSGKKERQGIRAHR